MRDLDQIKVSQLEVLDASSYNQEMKNEMMWKITVELACWFFLYVQQALECLEEDEVLSIINESLNYPSFRRIKEYLNNDRDDDWLQIHLIREGNPEQILKEAREYLAINKKKNRSLSAIAKGLIKKL